MVSEEKLLRDGFATAEAALAPLAAALPWMKNVAGSLKVPRSEFVFEHTETQHRIRYRVSVTAEKRGDHYAAILRVERVRMIDLLVPAIYAAGVVIYGCLKEPYVLLLLPVCGLMCLIGVRYVWRHAAEVSERFALAYAA